MTEIQFLIDLVLNEKLSPAAKKRCMERIGEVESSLTRGKVTMPWQPQPITTSEQAPMATIPPAQRVVGGEVQTGGNTRGPRKF